ncbi:hypothetical protein PM082_001852 [Marasmius tenuissimus]|nr:hypothetical protein PM082_001852 [Marasmius tenuissimus]
MWRKAKVHCGSKEKTQEDAQGHTPAGHPPAETPTHRSAHRISSFIRATFAKADPYGPIRSNTIVKYHQIVDEWRGDSTQGAGGRRGISCIPPMTSLKPLSFRSSWQCNLFNF